MASCTIFQAYDQNPKSEKYWSEICTFFAVDAAVASSEQQLQGLLDHFSAAREDFSITISLTKTQVMVQATPAAYNLIVKNFQLEVVHHFTYLGSAAAETSP